MEGQRTTAARCTSSAKFHFFSQVIHSIRLGNGRAPRRDQTVRRKGEKREPAFRSENAPADSPGRGGLSPRGWRIRLRSASYGGMRIGRGRCAKKHPAGEGRVLTQKELSSTSTFWREGTRESDFPNEKQGQIRESPALAFVTPGRCRPCGGDGPPRLRWKNKKAADRSAASRVNLIVGLSSLRPWPGRGLRPSGSRRRAGA
jgi:hypothetical protein